MATIQSQMVLNDGMSAVLRKITSALDTTLAAFEQMQRASGEALELATIEAARGELVGARQATDQWAESFSWAAEEEEKLNRGIERGTSATDGMLKKVVSLAGAFAGISAAKNFAVDAMGAADVQIGAQMQLQTVLNNMGTEESYQAIVRNGEQNQLESRFTLDVSEAVDSLQGLVNSVAGAELEGSFALDTTRAWEEYDRLAWGVGETELGARLALDTEGLGLPAQSVFEITASVDYAGIAPQVEPSFETAKAVKKYEMLQNNLSGARLGTAFSLDTTGAVDAYEAMVNGLSGAVLSLDTGGAQEEYDRLVGEIEGAELGNILFLDTAGATVGYRLFADSLPRTQTVELQADTGPALTAYDAILAKAAEIQSRGMYGDEAMIAGAAEFATYFSDANAILSMMDTLADYSAGMSGGAALDSQAMVDYATGLGKIMSGSYDAMNEKGFQFTDTQKAIIEGTANQAQIVEELGAGYLDMSQDMQAAAVINSVIAEGWGGLYEAMSNTPVGQVTQLGNALGDVKENIGAGIYPAFLGLVQAVQRNLPQIESAALGLAGVLGMGINLLTGMVEGALAFGSAVADNWGIIGPVVYGVVAALAAYAGYLGVTKALELASAAVKTVLIAAEYAHAAATGVAVAKTTAQTAAQMGLNTALLACPVTWIVLGIIALIAVIYAAVGAFNKFAGTSLSATGVIMAGFSMLGAFLMNYFVVPLQNRFAAVANFFGNVFHNPIGAVKVLFYDMCLTVLGYIQNMASGIETLLNRIPGVTIDITSGLDSFYSQLEQAQQAVKDESGWVEYVRRMDYLDYAEAADRGYAFGEKLADSVSDFFGGGLGSVNDLMNDIQNPLGEQSPLDGLDGLPGNVGGIAEDTDGIAGSLHVGSEELKYLRDIAERDAVNRFTTAEVKIDMTGMTNKIEGGADLDGVLRALTDGFAESLVTAAEGAHL
ncbi:MAG: hypothetical protein HFJ86_03200 [Oscillospiraceae bacterium]|jgi:hypothetical protein|nr:hypothetical protein [Oscillospiraceae bacterium]